MRVLICHSYLGQWFLNYAQKAIWVPPGCLGGCWKGREWGQVWRVKSTGFCPILCPFVLFHSQVTRAALLSCVTDHKRFYHQQGSCCTKCFKIANLKLSPTSYIYQGIVKLKLNSMKCINVKNNQLIYLLLFLLFIIYFFKINKTHWNLKKKMNQLLTTLVIMTYD